MGLPGSASDRRARLCVSALPVGFLLQLAVCAPALTLSRAHLRCAPRPPSLSCSVFNGHSKAVRDKDSAHRHRGKEATPVKERSERGEGRREQPVHPAASSFPYRRSAAEIRKQVLQAPRARAHQAPLKHLSGEVHSACLCTPNPTSVVGSVHRDTHSNHFSGVHKHM